MVYFIQQGECGPIKIGQSHTPNDRLKRLRKTIKEKLSIILVVDGHFTSEYALHEYLKEYCIGGEWFKPTKEVYLTMVRVATDKKFRESLRCY